MMWILRWWPSLLTGLVCVALTITGVGVELGVRFASVSVLLLAVLFLFLIIVSKFIPLDFGSYAHKMREQALTAAEVWQHVQLLNEQRDLELRHFSFRTIDRLFAESWLFSSVLYRGMSEDEEAFWCAYLRYRTINDETVLVSERGVRKLYEFLRARRTTPEGIERMVADRVIG